MSRLERDVDTPSNLLKKAPEVLMLIFLREISIDVRGVKSSFSVFSYFFAVFGDTRSLFCLLPSLTVFHRHNRFFQPLCIKFHRTVFSFYSIFVYYKIFCLITGSCHNTCLGNSRSRGSSSCSRCNSRHSWDHSWCPPRTFALQAGHNNSWRRTRSNPGPRISPLSSSCFRQIEYKTRPAGSPY